MSIDRTKILEAAQKHAAKGAYDKAIAELQKLVKADPNDVRTWLKIGDLYAKKGANKEAIEAYAKVAEQYSAQGFYLKAVAVYKQILKLDPSRLEIQVKLGEAYEKLQLVGEALATYEQVAAQYARDGNVEKALSTLAKMVELDPNNVPLRIKFAEALSKENKIKEAAEAFEAAANLLKAQGRIDDWIKVTERLLFHRPDDVEVARELSRCYLERQDAKRALPKLQICFKADPKHVPTLELLAEAFQQLGQLPKAISVYREIARIHQESGRAEERVRVFKRILELDPGDAEARRALAADAQPKLAPGFGPVRAGITPPSAAVASPAPRPPFEPQPQYEPENEEIEELDEDSIEQEVLEESELGAPPASEPPTASTSESAGQDGDVIIVGDEEPGIESPAPLTAWADGKTEPPQADVPGGLPELAPPTVVERVRPEVGPPPTAEVGLGADPLAPISPDEFERAPLRPRQPEFEGTGSPAQRSKSVGEVEEVLEEADFFVAQGLYGEAMTTLREALEAHPRNRLIAEKLAEIEDLAAISAAQARSEVSPALPGEDGSIQLAEKLAEDLGGPQVMSTIEGSDVLDVDKLFAPLKHGVDEQVGLEDTETHFDLGIAYREMGLLDDAIAEFQLCLANPQKQCVAYTMIGLCYLAKGQVSEAVAHFKKGLYVEHKTEREELGLYYELGRAHEMLHDVEEALSYYQKVFERDRSFRDVHERIEALTHSIAKGSGMTHGASGEDLDAVFDHRMGEREH